MTVHTVKISTLGSGVTALPDAIAEPITEEVNEPEDFSFRISNADPLSHLCRPFAIEAEIYEDGVLRFGGPIVDFEGAPGGMTRFKCKGYLEYLAQRNIDRVGGRINLLDGAVWTAGSEAGDPAPTLTLDSTRKKLDDDSIKLVSAAHSLDAFAETTVTHTATALGDALVLAAWYYVDGASYDSLGPAFLNRGLFGLVTGGSAGDLGVVEIDDATPKDQWVYVKTLVFVPPSATEDVNVRLYSIGGSIWWSAWSLTRFESYSKFETDQADIVAEAVTVLQDIALGKDDVALTADCPATGVIRDRHAQYVNQHNGLGWIQSEICALENGLDISCGPDRVVRTHYPRRGTDRTGTVTLEAGAAGNFLPSRYRFDGKKAGNVIAANGPGDGPDRVEGWAVDLTKFGGRTIQQSFSPPGDPDIDTLYESALRRLVVASDPRLLEGVIVDASLTVGLGDLVDVGLPTPIFHEAVTGSWRIVRITTIPESDHRPVVLVPG